MVYKQVVENEDSSIMPTFVEDDSEDYIGFEYEVVTGEGGTEVVYGENIIFSIGFALAYVNN